MLKGGRIMTIQAGDQFNGAHKKGDKISKDANKNVHLNLNEMDERIKNAKQIKPTGYGVRTDKNAKFTFEQTDTKKIFEAFKASGVDYYLPNFTQSKALEPARSNVFEVPLVRYNPAKERFYDDYNEKMLYVKQKDGSLAIGKEMPRTQPVVTHEWVEDGLQRLADKHKEDWEILPDQTYDEKKGFRRYWGILSKRLDQEVKDSFRIGDVVRFGAMVRNGIDEGLAVGFDLFTYAVLCQNGSIGRGDGLAKASWAHLGKVELFEKRVLEGLEQAFNVGQEFMTYITSANKIKMTNEHITSIYQNGWISDKHYNEQYFTINKDVKITDPKRIEIVKKDRTSLWEGYNAITAQVWHSDIQFGEKSRLLKGLNQELVQIVDSQNKGKGKKN